jgi:uncharacterized membrane protein
MRRRNRLAVALVLGAGATALAADCPRYELHAIIENTFCELAPGLTLEDINDAGEVVGEIRCLGGPEKPFVWRDGVMTLLPMPPGATQGFAKQINNVGQIAGYVAAGHWMAIRWDSDGSYVDVLDGEPGFLLGLNDHGDVVGYDDDGAFAIIDGVMHDIGALLDDQVSYPYDINDAGQVVGRYNPNGPDSNRAFLWAREQLVELSDLLDGAPETVALRISSFGVAVGYALDPTRAVRWAGARGEYLGGCDGFERSSATDVSDSGRIVGQCWGSSTVVPGVQGTLLCNGARYVINDLLVSTDKVE